MLTSISMGWITFPQHHGCLGRGKSIDRAAWVTRCTPPYSSCIFLFLVARFTSLSFIFYLATLHVGSQFPDQGSNLHSLH